MKTTLLAVALAMFGFASVAAAENFTNTMVTTTLATGDYELSATGTVDDEFGLGDDFAIYGSVETLDHTIAYWDANVEFTVGYASIVGVDAVIAGSAYQLETTTGAMTSSVEVAVIYAASADDIGDGEIVVSPTIGTSFAATDTLDVFGNVSYAWLASEDFADLGGTVEAGAVVAVTDAVDVSVSAVRSFDTANDTTQAALEVTFNF